MPATQPLWSLPGTCGATASFVSCALCVRGHNWLLPQGRRVTGGLTPSPIHSPSLVLRHSSVLPGTLWGGGLHEADGKALPGLWTQLAWLWGYVSACPAEPQFPHRWNGGNDHARSAG